MKRKNILSIKAAVIIGISFILIQSGLGVVGNGNFSSPSYSIYDAINKCYRWDNDFNDYPTTGFDEVRDIVEFDIDNDGNQEIIFCGEFDEIGGVSSLGVSYWDPETDTWSSLAFEFPYLEGEMEQETISFMLIYTIEVYNSNLYIGGHFETMTNHPMYIEFHRYLMGIWDQTEEHFELFGDIGIHGGSSAWTMKEFQGDLYIGGRINWIEDINARNLIKYNGGWSAVSAGVGGQAISLPAGASDGVYDLAVYDDGNGEDLYVAGMFRHALEGSHWDYVEIPNTYGIARWDGFYWSSVDGGLVDPDPEGLNLGSAAVYALSVFDDGSGPALFVGGDYYELVNLPYIVNHISKWDGNNWYRLIDPNGNIGIDQYGLIYSLETHNIGSRYALYVGGDFTTAGGKTVNNIAKWNGNKWTSLGLGICDRYGSGNPWVKDIYGYNNQLFVGGYFDTAYNDCKSCLNYQFSYYNSRYHPVESYTVARWYFSIK